MVSTRKAIITRSGVGYRLRDAIDKLNPNISQDAKEDALKKYCITKAPMP